MIYAPEAEFFLGVAEKICIPFGRDTAPDENIFAPSLLLKMEFAPDEKNLVHAFVLN